MNGLNIFGLIAKTVITTIDMLFMIVTFKSNEGQDSKTIAILFTMMNLVGVWLWV